MDDKWNIVDFYNFSYLILFNSNYVQLICFVEKVDVIIQYIIFVRFSISLCIIYEKNGEITDQDIFIPHRYVIPCKFFVSNFDKLIFDNFY